jgi:hypothetical protein
VGGCSIEGLLESHEELAGWGRGHGARHVGLCVLVVVWW